MVQGEVIGFFAIGEWEGCGCAGGELGFCLGKRNVGGCGEMGGLWIRRRAEGVELNIEAVLTTEVMMFNVGTLRVVGAGGWI